MPKTIRVDDLTYSELVGLSGELTAIIEKPIPLGLAMDMAAGILRGDLLKLSAESKAKIRATFQKIDVTKLEETRSAIYRLITGETKK